MFKSIVESGHPNTENGNKADENHVSRTSSSCTNTMSPSFTPNLTQAFLRASSELYPKIFVIIRGRNFLHYKIALKNGKIALKIAKKMRKIAKIAPKNGKLALKIAKKYAKLQKLH